ncbi:MAG: Gmad2 immunoglobulin-like domain-containing protein [Pseudomonadota bacterium]
MSLGTRVAALGLWVSIVATWLLPSTGAASAGLAPTPLDASYEIEGSSVSLANGAAEQPVAPDIPVRVRTSVLGEPVYGDLDRDGDDDAVLWLAQQPGGSGSFIYVAAALREADGFRGTTAVFLGDRIARHRLAIENSLVLVDFAEHGPTQAMVDAPNTEVRAYTQLRAETLMPITRIPPGEEILQGWLVIGHEVRSFRPCKEDQELWLTGATGAMSTIREAYDQAVPEQAYAPLFATMTGRRAAPPASGFGADYPAALEVSTLITTWRNGNCMSDRIVVDSPLPGTAASSPLTIRGRARGNWYFEGDFPIVLRGPSDQVLARSFASALGPWMVDGFVPFEGSLDFEPGHDDTGVLVLEKDNPSEDRSLDARLEVPVQLD